MAELASNKSSPQEEDLFAKDPFFKRKSGGNWNACIGKQGNELNYLDGYVEAAAELVNAVIDKKMWDKRDTLVLPILYNARHAVELSLKFTIDRLVEIGLLPSAPPRNHDIEAYWKLLDEADIGDEEMSRCIDALEPFITSLSRIDGDGQELRYHLNRSEDKSLATYSVANLEVIRDSLAELSKLISDLKYRTLSFQDEHKTNAFTNRCSRRDLISIAKLMPRTDLWKDPVFDEKKENVKSRFRLSNRQFSKALNVIKTNREMKAILGSETDLLHISDDSIVWVIEQWRKLHPPRSAGDESGIDYFDPARFEGIEERFALEREVIAALQEQLTIDEFADLEAIFYLGRDRWFSEHYEEYVDGVKKEYAVEPDPRVKIAHLMEKTNFLTAACEGLTKLGRLSLTERLAHL